MAETSDLRLQRVQLQTARTSIAAANRPQPGQRGSSEKLPSSSILPLLLLRSSLISAPPTTPQLHRPQWSSEASPDRPPGCSSLLPQGSLSSLDVVTRRQLGRSGHSRLLLTNPSNPTERPPSPPPTPSSTTPPPPRPLPSTRHSSSSLPTMRVEPPSHVSVTLPAHLWLLPPKANYLQQ